MFVIERAALQNHNSGLLTSKPNNITRIITKSRLFLPVVSESAEAFFK